MKMVMIAYNEALDNELMDILEGLALKSFTKIPKVFGRGDSSGTHLGTDIWPGLNNILYISCEDGKAKEVISRIRGLRAKIGHEGAKAFVLPVEEYT